MALKIFAPCSYTWGNKGDAALLLAMAATLRREFGPVEFVFTSFTPAADASRYGERFITMPLPPSGRLCRLIHRGPSRIGLGKVAPFLTLAQLLTFLAFIVFWIQIWRFMPWLGKLLAPSRVVAVAEAARASDLTIAVPGGYLMAPRIQDDYWLYHVATLVIPLLLGKPVVAYACSIGPFVGYHARVARSLLRRMRLIFAREEASLQHLLALGVDQARIIVTADSAFGLVGSSEGEAEAASVLQELGGRPRPWVGISVRDHSFPGRQNPGTLFQTYVSEVASMADHVVENLGGSPIFVPQCTGLGGSDDTVALRVRGHMRHRTKALVITEELSPHALQALYGRLDLMVGTRMHANVLAMTTSTPVLAIAYAEKTPGIMAMAGLAPHVIDITEVAGRLVPAFAKAWADRAETRRTLARSVPILRARGIRDARMLRTLLAGSPAHTAAASASRQR